MITPLLFPELADDVRIPKTGATPARPGTGPEGQTCRRCAHYTHGGTGRRRYPKCALMEHAWTSGKGTDIKATYPACAHFVPSAATH